jgi:uncharacterized membrane-anchored protein
VTGPALAQAEGDSRAAVQQFLGSLAYESGVAKVPEAGATIKLGDGFRYLAATDARRVLEDLWGNPPDDSVLGLIVPAAPGLAEDHGWAVVVTYSDDGHVSDEDAAGIDYAALLQDMQESTADENEARKAQGYPTVDLVGWAAAPRYDAAAKKLHWAKELAFDGSSEHTLNYDIRVLGRSGYLSLNAVASQADLATVEAGMREVLQMVEFEPGHRYADFNESTDKVAAYGVAALVGGVAASKAGLFAKLGLLRLKAKKLAILLLVGIGYVLKRVFGKKDASQAS